MRGEGTVGEGLKREHIRPSPEVLRRIAGQGIPAALNMLTIAIGIFVTMWFVQRFGKPAVVATGIAMRVEQIVLLPMIGGGLLVWLPRGPAMRMFSADPVVIGHGKDYLTVASMTLAAYPVLFVTVFAMQGIKRPGYGLWLGLYRQLVAPLLVIHALAFGLGWGLWGVWWGVSIVTWSAAIFSLFWGWRRLGR